MGGGLAGDGALLAMRRRRRTRRRRSPRWSSTPAARSPCSTVRAGAGRSRRSRRASISSTRRRHRRSDAARRARAVPRRRACSASRCSRSATTALRRPGGVLRRRHPARATPSRCASARPAPARSAGALLVDDLLDPPRGRRVGFLEDAGYAVYPLLALRRRRGDRRGRSGLPRASAARSCCRRRASSLRTCAVAGTFVPDADAIPACCKDAGRRAALATGVNLSLLLATGVGPADPEPVRLSTRRRRARRGAGRAARRRPRRRCSSRPGRCRSRPRWSTIPRLAFVDLETGPPPIPAPASSSAAPAASSRSRTDVVQDA